MAMHSPQILLDPRPLKPEDGPKLAKDSKEASQRYVVNEIKKLIEGCEDFIGLVAGKKGSPEILASPNLRQHRHTILGDAHGNFVQYLSDRAMMTGMSCSETKATVLTGLGKDLASARQASKLQKQLPETDSKMPSGSISYTFQRPPKRHRSRTINPRNPARPRTHQNSQGVRLVCETPASQIRVDDREKLEQWFEQAFLTLQQVACRLVAKIWIKKIHPKKQSTHPYNGGMPRGEPADSNRTKPPYWPKNVIHREPDHIGREDRTSLLVHLIMGTPQPIITNPPDLQNQQAVTAGDLLECLEVKRDELREDRWEILEQIARARQMMEQYEAGEIDGDSLVFLNDYSDGFRLTPNDSEDEVSGQTTLRQAVSSDRSHDEESAMEADVTPVSSAQNSPGATLHDGNLQASRHRGSMAGEGARSRRMAGRKPRLTGHTGRITSAMPPQHAQELQHDMAMGTLKGEYNIAGPMNDAMLCDPRGVLDPSHSGRGMMVGIPQQVPSNAFEGVLDHHASRDMSACLAPHGARHSLSSQGWLGMMPSDMGPVPLEQIFGLTPHIVTNPELGHAFYGQIEHDMGGSMQSGLSLMNPMQYHEYGDGNQRNLPLRGIDASQPGISSQQELKMDMMSGSYYRL
ncbi:hypothetical protein A1O1_07479 [Capronia coronata CBS 617.96]|uniref:Subtelomeric hrmA-associated cluster protein AFUB-079030/YDR124W-like helical bundle domain-containing protein n=1 Tax=Capronia coronata CBS 617.96 TaxID=1182541 RepID=W9Y3T4_9EURO|nr:uncharacterized protein A1O1_07479 [Capronia coronata CBS 617.96]EXJ83851.1 hypothetical protein A1O1_07479 [Capronia coronata CBS 617.96]